MKKLLIALAAVFITAASYGQGQLVFNTRVTGQVDAPVTIAGTQDGPGPTYSAQLYLSGAGGSLTALTPATTFRPPGTGAGAIANRYVLPADITVPGVAAGAQATIVMRAWQTSLGTADAALAAGLLGQSAPLTLTLGGGLNPPANLVGLQGFTIPVPEPSIIALGVLGASALLLRRRK